MLKLAFYYCGLIMAQQSQSLGISLDCHVMFLYCHISLLPLFFRSAEYFARFARAADKVDF